MQQRWFKRGAIDIAGGPLHGYATLVARRQANRLRFRAGGTLENPSHPHGRRITATAGRSTFRERSTELVARWKVGVLLLKSQRRQGDLESISRGRVSCAGNQATGQPHFGRY